ncbi:MAG: hypothetical protein R6V19_10355 [Armatimonadota bacterium]
MRKQSRAFPVALAAVIVVLLCAGMVAFAQDNDRLASLMQQTDLKFKVLSEYSYLVPFKTDDHEQLDVYVTYSTPEKECALIYTTVLDYEDGHDFRAPVMSRALQINNDYPWAKFALDAGNGDLDLQSEPVMRTLDAEALDMQINLIAALTDKFMDELSDLEEGNTQG